MVWALFSPLSPACCCWGSHLSEKVFLPKETYRLSLQTDDGAAAPLSPGTHSFSKSPCPWVVLQQVRGFHFQLATAIKSSHHRSIIDRAGNSWFCLFVQVLVFSPSTGPFPHTLSLLSVLAAVWCTSATLAPATQHIRALTWFFFPSWLREQWDPQKLVYLWNLCYLFL